MHSKTKQVTCFIAAEVGNPEVERLRARLSERNVLCYLALGETTFGSVRSNIESLIKRADFVAGFLTRKPAANVVFEIGMAIGAGKPLLLFASDPSSVPFDLATTRVLSPSVLKKQGENSYLDAFLLTLEPASRRSLETSVLEKHPTLSQGKKWARLRSTLESLSEKTGPNSGIEFERLVERCFKLAGFAPVASPGPDFGADFAVSTPQLNQAFKRPILIEAKHNVREHIGQSTIDQLARLIGEKRGGAGLLVTAKVLSGKTQLKVTQPIVIVPVDELIDWLRGGTFEEEFLFTVDTFWTRSI